MKTVLFLLCFVLAASFVQAVSVEQIGKLAELKTKDDLILELVRREGLDRPLTTEDVVMLREKGASERVLEYLLNLSPRESSIMSKQEGESVYITKNLRAFQTRDKKGKPILMVTNLDENGKRMGPPPPPTPEPEVVRETEQPVREVYVTVRHEEPERYEDEEEYGEDPYYQDSGIPLYLAYGYPYSANPYRYPVKPNCPKPGKPDNGHGNSQRAWGEPRARNSQPQAQPQPQMNTPRPASARVTSRSRW